MAKSLLYAVNSVPQTIATNGVISFGNIVRKFGNYLNISSGNLVTDGAGYYEIDANFTFVAGTTGNASIQLYKGGVAIDGAVWTNTVTQGDIYSLTIPCVIREHCCMEDTITAVLTASNGTINSAAIIAEKV